MHLQIFFKTYFIRNLYIKKYYQIQGATGTPRQDYEQKNLICKFLLSIEIRKRKIFQRIQKFCTNKSKAKTHGPSSPVCGHVTIHPLLQSCTEVYRVHTVSVSAVRPLFQYVQTTSKTVLGILRNVNKISEYFYVSS